MREFYSGQSENLLKSVEFLIHKDRFVFYLREFVRELQGYSGKIGTRLQELDHEAKCELLEWVVASELDIPRPMSEQSVNLAEQIRERIPGQWEILESWFCRADSRMSESDMVLEVTNEIIRKMIQNAAMILQMQGGGMNRKEDYRQYIRMFQECRDISEVHCLAAVVFGVFQIEHFKINGERMTDSINSSVYEEEPMEFPLTPRTNKYRPRIDKTGFETRTLETFLAEFMEVDWTRFTERKSLVRMFKFAEAVHVLVAYEGSSDSLSSGIEHEILYENTGLSRYFAVHFTRDISGVRGICALYVWARD